MNYLVYGILSADAVTPDQLPPGLDGRPVFLVTDAGVAAAVSEADGPTAPAVPRLLAYAGVIAALARLTTVLPLRYGCLLDSTARVRDLLTRGAAGYRALLCEVAGCVELSLRVLLPDADGPPTTPPVVGRPTGRSYLAARQVQFARNDAAQAAVAQVTRRVVGGLANRYVRAVAAPPAGDSPRLVTVYFLVPAAGLDRFREAVQELQTATAERLLLTGPWPPYNFVADPAQEPWP